MKTIYKYPLAAVDEQEIDLPEGAEILSVKNQQETIVMYALVDTEVEGTKARKIVIHGTGHDLGRKPKKSDKFIGTVALGDGELMYHVFAV